MVARLPGLLRSVPPRVWGAGLQDRGRETFFVESGPRRRPCRELRAIKTLWANHASLGNCEFSASVAAGTLAAIASAWLVYCRARALPKLLQDLTIES